MNRQHIYFDYLSHFNMISCSEAQPLGECTGILKGRRFANLFTFLELLYGTVFHIIFLTFTFFSSVSALYYVGRGFSSVGLRIRFDTILYRSFTLVSENNPYPGLEILQFAKNLNALIKLDV